MFPEVGLRKVCVPVPRNWGTAVHSTEALQGPASRWVRQKGVLRLQSDLLKLICKKSLLCVDKIGSSFLEKPLCVCINIPQLGTETQVQSPSVMSAAVSGKPPLSAQRLIYGDANAVPRHCKIMRVFHSQKYLAGFTLHICLLSAHAACHHVWYQVLPVNGVGGQWLFLMFRFHPLPEERSRLCLSPLPDTDCFSFPYLPHFPTRPAPIPQPPHLWLPTIFTSVLLSFNETRNAFMLRSPSVWAYRYCLTLQAKHQWAVFPERGEEGKGVHRGVGHLSRARSKAEGLVWWLGDAFC